MAGNAETTNQVRDAVETLYRTESRRIFATLIRLVGDFDLAEEAMHDAFAAALPQWEAEGIPEKPRAWIVSTGRFKAIDIIRRRARLDATLLEQSRQLKEGQLDEELDETRIDDDQLRLIFTCCHPLLSPEVQVALTLREVCGLTTEEVARAFLVSTATIAQRIVRGKAKIREAEIPYVIPSVTDLPERLDSALSVIYLVFNEGYSASSGEAAIRSELSAEAIRLGRLLRELLPDPEALGLLALMLLHESRRSSRTDAAGELILLEDQNRALWDRELIAEGTRLVEQALTTRRFGGYAIQAAIAAVHAGAASSAETDWAQIVALYDVLHSASPSPVVELNRAVAVAMRDGAAAGLNMIDAILNRGDLRDYHLAHAARADLCRRLGRNAEARAAYLEALSLVRQEPERRLLQQRLEALDG